MNALETERDRWLDQFAAAAQRGPSWLAPLRRDAIERFAALGLPTRKGEAWKYTNVAPIAKAALQVSPASSNGLSRSDAESFGGGPASLVLVNGTVSPELSSPTTLSGGARAVALAGALETDAERVRALLESDLGPRPFAALNTAFANDGAFVHVPAGVVVEEPIRILLIATDGMRGAACHPRNLVVVEDGAHAAVELHYLAASDAVYLTNAVTQIDVGANAGLDLVVVQREAGSAFHLGVTRSRLARDARFHSHLVALGGGLARHEIDAELAAPGAECVLDGLFVGADRQHHDHQTLIDHAAPHGSSRELYKGVLGGHSRGIFNGGIVVRPGAQKTDAQQSNPNLLTSNSAQVNTRPNLEIHADDVKCSHGSTIGHLDETALFYLRSRGIAETSAREILTRGFAAEVIDAIPVESLRGEVSRWVGERLGEAA